MPVFESARTARLRRGPLLAIALLAALPARAQDAAVRGAAQPEVPAEILALRDAEIRAEVAGRVVERPEDDTGRVEADAVVVRLDDELARADAEAARGLADQAQAQRAWAETELRRARDLLAAGSVEQARFDEAEVALRRTTAAALAAEATARLAEARLARTHIRAPFAGRLVHVYPDVGEYLTPGLAAFRIVDDTSLRVVGYVPAELVTRLEPGQRCRVVPTPRTREATGGPGAGTGAEAGRPEAENPEAASDTAPEAGGPEAAPEAAPEAGTAEAAGPEAATEALPALPATIFSVAPAAEGASRTFRVEARVAPAALAASGARRWRPGMTAMLVFEEVR